MTDTAHEKALESIMHSTLEGTVKVEDCVRRRDVERIMDLHLAASDLQRVPEDYVIVPKVVTTEMRIAGAKCLPYQQHVARQIFGNAYEASLAAAPKPEATK